jgi:riboflavin kinase / FMN adenylyltransferase
MGFAIFAAITVQMIVHKGYENLNLVIPVVTLGIFDGVHLGHRSLLDFLIKRTGEVKGESVVVTFFPHPRLVLDQNHPGLSFLTTMEEKMILLEKADVDHLVILKFTKKFSKINACDFVRDILVEKIGAKHLILGYNNHFGRRGEGDFESIKQCSDLPDLTVEQVPRLNTEQGVISSSLIRDALMNGRLDVANNLLGYYYSVSGTVIGGKMVGRSIGFPTANIKPSDKYKLIPGNGVYAVEVQLDAIVYPGMLNIGTNPTVNDDISVRSIEVHILDFEEDIYGKEITVIFRKRLRDEKKFTSIEQLAEQMAHDRQDTIRLLIRK